ncbi:MAG: formylglycine-generating enzyme family protein, partial [Arenimonas sp.]|nr:formylglycine-generating enzyme family protein [Arenimonas sp.]
QEGDYAASERLQAEAGRIVPDSTALQDMAARIVELRQSRTEQLLAQGHAAVDALDLELAARRLAEAEQVSLQAQGLDALGERIVMARHYGRFRPGQVFREPLAIGGEAPEMVVLAHGRFEMGSPEDEGGRFDNEGPRHEVAFARGFAIARNETTVAEFRAFVEATGHRSVATRRGRSTVYDEKGGVMGEHGRVDWRRDYAGSPAPPELPVVHVAFEDAEAYAAWLSAQTGQRYRLPSEAEFEYALRAGRAEAYPWGEGVPPRVVGNLTGDGDESRLKRKWANAIPDYADGHWGPAPVRSYPAEAFGTFDLVGNVSEWVLDCWHDSYRRAPRDGSAWVNPGCGERVLRGASWASSLERARSAYRQSAPADTTNARVGFRVVREL